MPVLHLLLECGIANGREVWNRGKSMKICLIIPPSVFLLDERVFMTLGILKVAAVLEQKNIPVDLLDLSGISNFEKVIEDYLFSSKVKIFGLTATTPQLPAAARIVATIRRFKPLAKIILGGPHVTLVNAAYKKETKNGVRGRATKAFEKLQSLFDVLVAGDGEEAIFLALAKEAPSLIDADDPQSSMFHTNEALTKLPFPARHLVDVPSYRYSIDNVRALSIIAQLGCPFACGFCGGRESSFLRRIRLRSTENIIEEMKHLYKSYGAQGFMFYDDELNVNPKMIELMEAITKLQRDLNTQFRLRGFIKSHLFNDDQAKAMGQAGFRWILTGFESGSPRILTNINKSSTQEQNTHCIEVAKRHGLKVKALMSIGHPGESEETVLQTHDWLLKVKPEDFDVTIITTYPGTPYYDHATIHPEKENIWVYAYQKTGDKLFSEEVDYTEVADYYKGDPDGGYRSFVFTDYLSKECLVKARDFIERDVRKRLTIPFNPGAVAVRYEHSMGQMGGRLPSNILKSSI